MSKIYKSFQMKESNKKLISHTYNPTDAAKVNGESDKQNSEKENEKNKILEEAKSKAETIIRDAKEESEKLLLEEKNKIEKWWKEKRDEDSRIIQDAEKKGYESGYSKAETDLKRQYEDTIKKAEKILENAYSDKEKIIQESEEVIIELSTEIAKKIILKEIELNNSIILDMTKNILKLTKENEKISIYVDVEFYNILQESRNDLKKELNGGTELLIFPDPSIDNGGLIVKTSNETLDAKIDSQLEELKTSLIELTGRRLG